ncbi:XdhC family protein [Peribacillus alkalitolerans]|uniref:XdhC family protein n=1 Tax=Peribacillus alkalitolerans TaxID=1550385 RepID=UPI0013D08940|nr:XdhC family protein [Peribacillus alkalitolerans]
MEDIFQIISKIEDHETKRYLSTIIHVEGSAYRKEGAALLIEEAGTLTGVLSAGCLEQDLVERVKGMGNKNESISICYDMRSVDDLNWGQGAGCNGVLYVLLEPITERFKCDLFNLKSQLDQGIPVTVIKKLTNSLKASDYLFISKQGDIFGSWNDRIPVDFIHSSQLMKPSGLYYSEELASLVYIHCYSPKPRLFIFGAGDDVKPLHMFASKTGFSVIISDWREGLCTISNFPYAESLLYGNPSQIIDDINFRPQDSVVVMTHQFEKDKEILELLKTKRNIVYFGVLGSRLRTRRLLNHVDIPEWISTPVGLDIGAEGPEEIAISILAEIIQTLRKNKNHRVESSWKEKE